MEDTDPIFSKVCMGKIFAYGSLMFFRSFHILLFVRIAHYNYILHLFGHLAHQHASSGDVRLRDGDGFSRIGFYHAASGGIPQLPYVCVCRARAVQFFAVPVQDSLCVHVIQIIFDRKSLLADNIDRNRVGKVGKGNYVAHHFVCRSVPCGSVRVFYSALERFEIQHRIRRDGNLVGRPAGSDAFPVRLCQARPADAEHDIIKRARNGGA